MVLNENDREWMRDIVNAARSIERFVLGKTLIKYLSDEILQAKVKEKIGLIGIAVRKLSPELRAAHVEIAWSDLFALQDVIDHDFVRVQHEQIWRAATREIPEIAGLIAGITDSSGVSFEDEGECEFHAGGL